MILVMMQAYILGIRVEYRVSVGRRSVLGVDKLGFERAP